MRNCLQSLVISQLTIPGIPRLPLSLIILDPIGKETKPLVCSQQTVAIGFFWSTCSLSSKWINHTRGHQGPGILEVGCKRLSHVLQTKLLFIMHLLQKLQTFGIGTYPSIIKVILCFLCQLRQHLTRNKLLIQLTGCQAGFLGWCFIFLYYYVIRRLELRSRQPKAREDAQQSPRMQQITNQWCSSPSMQQTLGIIV